MSLSLWIWLRLAGRVWYDEHKGSRIAFEEAKATPRVNVADTPTGFPIPRGSWETVSPAWSQLGVSSFAPRACTHWSDVGGAVVLL